MWTFSGGVCVYVCDGRGVLLHTGGGGGAGVILVWFAGCA